MMVVALALAGSFAFRGGSPQDFVIRLEKSFGAPVVLFLENAAPIPSGTARWDEESERFAAIRKKWNFEDARHVDGEPNPTGLSLWRKAYPAGMMSFFALADYRGIAEKIPTKEIQTNADRVSVTTAGQYAIRVGDLSNVGFSKPIGVHWFYTNALIVAAAHDVPEDEFLRLVAEAIGAKLISDERSYTFDLDPKQLRQRWQQRLREDYAAWRFNAEPAISARYLLDIALLDELTDDDLKQAFQEPGARVERTLTKEGKLWKTVQQWLGARLNPPANVNVPDGERRTRQQIADMIDFDYPAFGIGLDTSNGPTLSVRLKAKGNLGWISL
jgi:hypothetical protein